MLFGRSGHLALKFYIELLFKVEVVFKKINENSDINTERASLPLTIASLQQASLI